MAALDFGDGGRPVDVVFAHANGFNAMTYRSILGPLSLSLRIVAVDLRGHGASRLPAEPKGRRSWRDLRDDLTGLLDSLGDHPMVMAGHSMGATASLLASVERPKRVRSLVLLDPVILSRTATWAAKAPWLFGMGMGRGRALSEGALRRRPVFESNEAAFKAYRGRGAFSTWPEVMLADYVAAGFHDRPEGGAELNCSPAWEASNYAAQSHDPWAALSRARFPVYILRSETASACRLGPGDRLLRRRRNLQLSTVAGTTHFPAYGAAGRGARRLARRRRRLIGAR